MTTEPDTTTAIEQELARELDTQVSAGAAAERNTVANGDSRLSGAMQALAKLNNAIGAAGSGFFHSGVPEIPGFANRGEIGRGGMGIVIKAWDSALDREVAIKFLSPALARDANSRGRFLAEARALARLRHPHLVAVHAAGEVDGRPYFAMELVGGTTLDRAISECKKNGGGILPTDRGARARIAARLFIEIAHALSCVHRAGLIHRDIKPSNILIAADGTARLADFGIAADVRQSDKYSDSGTLRYVSPERIIENHGAEDPRSDIYSLGISLIEAVQLDPVFPQKTTDLLKKGILAGAPAAVGGRSIDEKILQIAHLAAARNPADRPADAMAFAAMLQEALQTRRIYNNSAVILLAIVTLAATALGIAYIAGAFNPRPNNESNGSPGLPRRDPRDFNPGPGRIRAPGRAPRGVEFERDRMDPMALIPRLQDLSISMNWNTFHRDAEKFVERAGNDAPEQIVRAWIIALQEKPDREKARQIVQSMENLPEPLERHRRELIEFLDGRALLPQRGPRLPGGPRPPGDR